MRTGGCYCGAVRYELAGEPGPLMNCHCRGCRHANSAAFITVTLARTPDLTFTEGADLVREFRSGEGYRLFCERCGGRLLNRPASNADISMLLVATLDEEPTTAPIMHINVASKAPWYAILDDLPQFEGLPPGSAQA